MQKNIFLAVIITAVVVGGSAFYGGIKYAQNKSPDFRNLTFEQRQQRMQYLGNSASGGRGGTLFNRGGDFVMGEILSKDDKSITVKLRDGGSKIIFYSQATEISKFVSGAPDDLQIGKNISVNGKANSDGSLTAQTIQLRPDVPNSSNKTD